MFTEQEKLEITIEGIQNGDIFMNEEGIAVDEYGDPIFDFAEGRITLEDDVQPE